MNMPINPVNAVEAKEWLAANQSESGFATNRFGPTAAARDFVDQLYGAGAIRVMIPNDSIRADRKEIEEMRGPYADALFFELPESDSEELFRLYEAEAEYEGYEGMRASESIIDERFLYLWWD